MAFIQQTQITDLNSNSVKWIIRVRAQSIWKGISRESKEFRGTNMLCIDDCRSRIHAFIPPKYADAFEKDLKEGEIYELKNFIVQDYSGLEFNRCVRFEKHIVFAQYTKMVKCNLPGLAIPKLCFDICRIQDLEIYETDKSFLCDIAGVVEDSPPPLREYVNDNEEMKKQKKFSISDSGFSVNITFFDDFAKEVDDALTKAGSTKIVVIISSAKVGRFQGELNITNFPATRCHINPEHPVAHKIRQRNSMRPVVPRGEETITQLNVVPPTMLSVTEIKKCKTEKHCILNVTVRKLKKDLPWFYPVCTPCNVELDMFEGRFKCPKCSRHFPWPQKRFRVCIVCSDKTGFIPLILGDREIRKITGKTVFDVELDQTEEKEGSFPPIFDGLLRKEYSFIIAVTKENVVNTTEVFSVVDMVFKAGDFIGKRNDDGYLYEEPEDAITIPVPTSTPCSQKATPSTKPRKEIVHSVEQKHGTNKRAKKEEKIASCKQEMKKGSMPTPSNTGSIANKKRNASTNRYSLAADVDVYEEVEDMTLSCYQQKNKFKKVAG